MSPIIRPINAGRNAKNGIQIKPIAQVELGRPKNNSPNISAK